MKIRKTVNKAQRWMLMWLLCLLPAVLVFAADNVNNAESGLSWPKVTKECKPWTYWWWMGSAVDKKNLTEHLEKYRKVGMGGVHIIPIYGVKGYEEHFIDYLSSKWMEMLEHTIKEAKRLGMGVDMTTGTGWPFGGPQVGIEDADAKVVLKTYTLDAGTSLSERLQKDTLQVLMAYSDQGEAINLTEKVDKNGLLNWIAPAGKWQLYAVSQEWSGMMVKRAAPGAEGYTMNCFSRRALRNYLPRFDKAFAEYQGDLPRSFYHDSYEYYGNWTDNLFEEFEFHRGYDLRRHLPALFGKGSDDVVARVKSDYRETISDLLLEDFTIPWVKWSHKKGILTRNEADCSPGNLLDLYAAVDIPETQMGGPSGFEIPGLRVSYHLRDVPQSPLTLKFSSSAAHLTGKRRATVESCTWLAEHFRVALSQVKPEMDQLFISGINHIFYHGMAYSPPDEPWPGWLFYASTHFGTRNSFWRDLPELNAYIARCQSFLQNSQPDNDILLYFPIYDIWHNKDGLLYKLTIDNIHKWLGGSSFHKSARTLWDRGYTFDYVSDRLLENVRNLSEELLSSSAKYRAVVVSKCRFMPATTLRRLIDLAKGGATIIIHCDLPTDVPGFGNLSNRRKLFKQALTAVKFTETSQPGISKASVGKGQFLMGENLEQMLELRDVVREPVVDTTGVEFIRRTHSQGHHYFLANLGKHHLDGWVKLGVKAKSVVIFDPRFRQRGLAAVRQAENGATEVYLQLKPGDSCILRTFSSQKIDGPKWRYSQPKGQPCEIKGTWKITFIKGGPKLPAGFETKTLNSWTTLGGPEARAFSGTANYTITFGKPAGDADDWLLDLGRVCESARVRINGRYVGALFSIPFQIPVGEFLRKGKNTLEVEVTNLMANRVADLERRKVVWQRVYYDSTLVATDWPDISRWAPRESGLLGPVHLVPLTSMKHSDLCTKASEANVGGEL